MYAFELVRAGAGMRVQSGSSRGRCSKVLRERLGAEEGLGPTAAGSFYAYFDWKLPKGWENAFSGS